MVLPIRIRQIMHHLCNTNALEACQPMKSLVMGFPINALENGHSPSSFLKYVINKGLIMMCLR
jgi:hypothetical protein